MEKLRYWNFLGEVFELEEAWVKCLELEGRAAGLLSRLQGRPGGGLGNSGLEAELRGFLGGLSREMRSVTPRPPARPIGWDMAERAGRRSGLFPDEQLQPQRPAAANGPIRGREL